jgi:hypothetical protein
VVVVGRGGWSVRDVFDEIRNLALQRTTQTIQGVNIQTLNVTSDICPDASGVDAGQCREFGLSLNATVSHHLLDSEFQSHSS